MPRCTWIQINERLRQQWINVCHERVGADVLGGDLGPMQVYANKDEEQMVTDIVHRYAHESQVEDDKKDEAEMELIQVFVFLP